MSQRNIRFATIFATAALGVAVASTSLPIASAMMNAPLTKQDDEVSRSIAHLAGGVCSGVLVAPEWVLTADHCHKTLPGHENDMQVVEPGQKVAIGPDVETQEIRTVKNIYSHPSFDAMLVRLDSAAKTIPAQVYSQTKEVEIGTETISYGWGDLVGEFDKKPGYQTGKIVTPVYASAQGYTAMKDGANNKLDENSLMVTGDSGGPLFLSDGRLYGVLSGGNLAEEKEGDSSTTVYSHMPKILDWMIETTGIDFASPENNRAIQAQLKDNPPEFLAPEKSMYAHTNEQEKEHLKAYLLEIEKSGFGSQTETIDVPNAEGVEDKDDKAPSDEDSNQDGGSGENYEEGTSKGDATSSDENTESLENNDDVDTGVSPSESEEENNPSEGSSKENPENKEDQQDQITNNTKHEDEGDSIKDEGLKEEEKPQNQSENKKQEDKDKTPSNTHENDSKSEEKDKDKVDPTTNSSHPSRDSQRDSMSDEKASDDTKQVTSSSSSKQNSDKSESKNIHTSRSHHGPQVDTGGSVMTTWEKILAFFSLR